MIEKGMIKNIGKILIRITFVSFYALLVMKLVGFAMPDNIQYQVQIIPRRIFLLLYFILFNLNTEGCFFFDRYLNKKLLWFYAPQKRIYIQLGFLLLWSFITIGIPFIIWYYLNGESLAYPPASVIIFIGAIVFLLVFTTISISINFFKQWQKSLLDAENFKQEKLKADYRVLQNQVNPHFLFNSLNVLISEIKHHPDTAIKFTRKLSKVYRYVLQSKNYDLIPLKKELEFIESFIFLHKVRIGEALDYSVEILEEMKSLKLPPLTLQILIENAIKHNVANEENVLKISITSKGEDTLIVTNNLQIIEGAESTYTGLSNLNKRFELLNKEGFHYEETQENFIVNIPLIDE